MPRNYILDDGVNTVTSRLKKYFISFLDTEAIEFKYQHSPSLQYFQNNSSVQDKVDKMMNIFDVSRDNEFKTPKKFRKLSY